MREKVRLALVEGMPGAPDESVEKTLNRPMIAVDERAAANVLVRSERLSPIWRRDTQPRCLSVDPVCATCRDAGALRQPGHLDLECYKPDVFEPMRAPEDSIYLK